MNRPWLVRTKNNDILGPFTKEKVKELMLQGKLFPEDEICSGNGHWFFIREKELVERFFIGDELQGFNPVSEAESVLSLTQNEATKVVELPVPPSPDLKKVEEKTPSIATPQVSSSSVTDKKEKRRELPPRQQNQTEIPIRQKESFFTLDKLVFLLGLAFLAFAIVVFLFRKKILNDYIHLSWIESAEAQTIDQVLKKKI